MSAVFSFIKHPILGLLEKSNQLFPGLEKAIALYFDNESNKVVCKGIHMTQSEPHIEEYAIEDQQASNKLRTRKIQFQWMAAQNLPFETVQSSRKQLNIFDELDNVVLCLGFKNERDKQSDLLFLYLNHNKGNFGVSNSNQNLTTSEKSIIGAMAYNSLNIYRKQQMDDAETLKLINQKVQFLHNENEKLNGKLANITENYLSSIIEMSSSHLKELSDEYDVQFSFAPDAIEKLKYFSGKFNDLKAKISQSAVLGLNLNYGQNSSRIVLKAWDIDFSQGSQFIGENQDLEINDRYQKTMQLLNKLENAARSVVNKNKRLTSENVGYACPTPISAPAISDALKNHQKKLVKLMHDHPEKWPTIRNEFRPIKNILVNVNAG